MEKNVEQELLTISSGDSFQPFRWSAGEYGSRFLRELKENKTICGIRCPSCSRVYVPPRKVCGRCHVAMHEFVPLSDEGEIYVCTIIRFGFVDPETGKPRPVPYGYAFIKIDGADTCLTHFVDCTDPKILKPGARVKAVFEEDRTGSVRDIKHFKIV